MLRLYLSEAERLHVWTRAGRVARVSDVHDHPWHFTSVVVSGRVRNVRYAVEEESEQESEARRLPYGKSRRRLLAEAARARVMGPGEAAYEEGTIVCGQSPLTRGVIGESRVVRLWERLVEDLGPGEHYQQRANEVHRSEPEDGAVTLCMRRFLPDTEHARVYWPSGTKWVAAEPRLATHEEIAEGCAVALARLESDVVRERCSS